MTSQHGRQCTKLKNGMKVLGVYLQTDMEEIIQNSKIQNYFRRYLLQEDNSVPYQP